MISPKLRGVRSSLEKFHHTVDAESEKTAQFIENASAAVVEKLKNVREKVDFHAGAVHDEIKGVQDYLTDLDRLSNGAPTSGDSQGSSTPGEPHKSWQGER